MASIRKRGSSYQLIAYVGYDSKGKQIRRTKSWNIPPGMSAGKAEKEATKAAFEFEKLLLTGQIAEKGKIKLCDFARQWFGTYAENQLRPTTAKRYYDLYYGRIDPVFGSMYLDKITPSRIDTFYTDLKKVRKEPKYQYMMGDFKAVLNEHSWTQASFSKQFGISLQVLRACIKKQNISKSSAMAVASAFSLPLSTMFEEIDTGTLSDKTRLEYHRLLSTLFSSAVKKGYIVSNPCERADPPKVAKKDVEYLDTEQAITLLSLLQEEPIYYRVPITVLLFTGMRRGELLGLEWSDINFKSDTIDINKSLLYLSDRGLFEDDTKNFTSKRVIKVYHDIMVNLKEYHLWQMEERIRLGDAWQESTKVFTTAEGATLRPDTLSGWFRGFIARHPELPNVHIHSLRHSNASLMIAEGVDIVTVAGILGHANANTTAKIYAHQIKSAQAAAAETVGGILTMKQNLA